MRSVSISPGSILHCGKNWGNESSVFAGYLAEEGDEYFHETDSEYMCIHLRRRFCDPLRGDRAAQDALLATGDSRLIHPISDRRVAARLGKLFRGDPAEALGLLLMVIRGEVGMARSFTCRRCGQCCQEFPQVCSDVELEKDDVRRWQREGALHILRRISSSPETIGIHPNAKDVWGGLGWFGDVGEGADQGSWDMLNCCPWLKAVGRGRGRCSACEIHETKPWACRLFVPRSRSQAEAIKCRGEFGPGYDEHYRASEAANHELDALEVDTKSRSNGGFLDA